MSIVATIVLGATVIPLLVGWRMTPEGKCFLWNTRLNAEDIYTYLAWMDQGARGHLLFVDRYTSEPQSPALFLPLFLGGGLAARLFHLPLMAAFHLMRVALGALLLYLVYRWIAEIWEDVATRRVCLLIVLLSSGLGWLVRSWGLQSVDLGIPEAITFMSLYQSPLFLAGLVLTLILLTGITRSSKEHEGRHLFLLGASSALLTWTHPYDLVTVFAVGIVWSVLVFARAGTWRPALLRLLVVLGGALPAALHQVWIISAHPVYSGWSRMVRGVSPSPLGYLLGFGLLIPLALLGVRQFWSRSSERRLLPIVWVAVTAVLVYAPVSFQRRLIQGIHLPLSILAMGGLASLVGAGRGGSARNSGGLGPLRKTAIVLLIAVLSLSNARMIVDDIAAYRTAKAPYYIRAQYFEAFRWLREHTRSDEIVFSSYPSGSFIAGIAGNTVYAGHWGLTVRAEAKVAQIARFLADNSDDVRKEAFLRGVGAKYLFYGEAERNLGSYDPERKSYLRRVFDGGVIRIYALHAGELLPDIPQRP